MKNIKIILSCMLFPFLVTSQNSETTSPLVSPENVWISHNYFWQGPGESTRYTFKDSVEIFNNKAYLRFLYVNEQTGDNWNASRLYRQDSSKVYTVSDGMEHLYYDFSLSVGDTMKYSLEELSNVEFVVVEIDSVTMLDNTKRKRLQLRCSNDPDGTDYGLREWVEGMGDLFGVTSLSQACILDGWELLSCFSSNDELLYQRFEDEECWFTLAVLDISDKDLQIYPNPTQGELRISTELNLEKLQVFSSVGQLIMSQDYVDKFSVSVLPQGLYILVFTDDTGNQIVRRFLRE